jgi:hypothetical protein
MKTMKALLASLALLCVLLPVSTQAQQNVLNFTDREIPQGVLKQISQGKTVDIASSKSNGKNWGHGLTVVKLSGKTNHFGRDVNTGAYIDYWATVPGVRVWMSEYPSTRSRNIRTDSTGWWTMYIVKYAGVNLEFSFVYEKDGWITTKSNAITVTDKDDTDLAIQYIDPLYYQFYVKPYVQAVWLDEVPFQNAMVVTVGKSWASMHSDLLPHGDPGATTVASPSLGLGPIYFNEDVFPDPGQATTSVDGGVTWLNMPLNHTYYVTAHKEGVNYQTVKFKINEADLAYGVELYIASPPDSVQGDNDSAPGQP